MLRGFIRSGTERLESYATIAELTYIRGALGVEEARKGDLDEERDAAGRHRVGVRAYLNTPSPNDVWSYWWQISGEGLD